MSTRRTAPARRIIGREVSGNQVTDRLECGHTITTRYTGWQTHRRCTLCAQAGLALLEVLVLLLLVAVALILLGVLP